MKTAIVVGKGQIGSVLAEGFERTGHCVVVLSRGDSLEKAAEATPDPAVVALSVREADLPDLLRQLPPAFRGRVLLVQNELVPRTWEAHGIAAPTVAVVWFEKKDDHPIR